MAGGSDESVSSVLVVDARVVLPGGVIDGGWVSVEGGLISGVGEGVPSAAVRAAVGGVGGRVVDAGGGWLLPGFVDVHVHGAVGYETMDGDVAGLEAMAGFYARHGVTGFLATTWTGSGEETLAALGGVVGAMEVGGFEGFGGGARLLGVHMEGPYLNGEFCGAQDAGWIRSGDVGELHRFLDTGVVRLVTLAPEVGGNLDLVDVCRSRGVGVSAGHTGATYEQMVVAVERGLSHVTHTFNAMRPLHHREPGVVGAALTMPELSVELIGDGIHVHPVAVRALFAARGVDGVVLVTDAVRATGMPEGEFAIGDRRATVENGAVVMDGVLAGSALTMDRGLRNVVDATGLGLGVLWPVASRNGARVAGVADRLGEIGVGMLGDLVVVDDGVGVLATVVGGRVVFEVSGEGVGGEGVGVSSAVTG